MAVSSDSSTTTSISIKSIISRYPHVVQRAGISRFTEQLVHVVITHCTWWLRAWSWSPTRQHVTWLQWTSSDSLQSFQESSSTDMYINHITLITSRLHFIHRWNTLHAITPYFSLLLQFSSQWVKYLPLYYVSHYHNLESSCSVMILKRSVTNLNACIMIVMFIGVSSEFIVTNLAIISVRTRWTPGSEWIFRDHNWLH